VLRRTGFKRKTYCRPQPAPLRRVERSGVIARITDDVRPQPKEDAIQSEAYMAIVRKLPCMRCGIVGFTQFCHADEGKGMGIKTDCRRGWPGCGPHGDEPGCHWVVGTSGQLPREEKRETEDGYGRRTRGTVLALGLWPKSLPLWPEATASAESAAAESAVAG
jgi:hypothetical protein